jgi:hypothetical protein
MTTVITAPARETELPDPAYRVYLAGAIDMGKAVEWQSAVIEALSDFPDWLILFNPRRAQFAPEMETEQIQWEWDAMDHADLIFLWFPKDSLAPIAFFEAGLLMGSNKLIIGAEPGFYRRRNLELTCPRYDVFLRDSLDALISKMKGLALSHLGLDQ